MSKRHADCVHGVDPDGTRVVTTSVQRSGRSAVSCGLTLAPVVEGARTGGAAKHAFPRMALDEAVRLAELFRLDVMDLVSLDCIDRTVRMAMRLLDVPLALVGFVDATREWCLSPSPGFPLEITRELSFAARVVESCGIVSVEEASSDLGLYAHPLVSGPNGVRFLAGCPVRSPSGAAVGALCVMDRQSRRLSDIDAEMLAGLAAAVGDGLAPRVLRCVDEGTGLLLRPGLDVVADHVIARARRYGEPVSLVVIDLDAAAGAPGRLAPAAGEPLVRAVAHVLRTKTRASDVSAHLPCDEVVVLLPGTDERRAAMIARRVRHELSRLAAEGCVQPFAARLATATLDPAAEELSLAALLRRAEPLIVDDVIDGGARGRSPRRAAGVGPRSPRR